MEFWKIYFATLGGLATVIGLIRLFGKSLLEQWLKRDYKKWESELEQRLKQDFKRYEIKLDAFASNDEVRFNYRHLEQAKAISQINILLVNIADELAGAMVLYVPPSDCDESWGYDYKQYADKLYLLFDPFQKALSAYKAYVKLIDYLFDRKIAVSFRTVSMPYMELQTELLIGSDSERKAAQVDVINAVAELKADFRTILGISFK